MKLIHGQRVTCEIEGVKISDAKITIEDGEYYLCQNEVIGANTDNKLGYKHSWFAGYDEEGAIENYKIRPHTPRVVSFDDPQVGDEYKRGSSSIYTVLGTGGRCIHLSGNSDKDVYLETYTKEELIRNGFTPVQPVEPEVEKLWYVDARMVARQAQVHKNDKYGMENWRKRAEVGNAFSTKEEAEEAARKMREVLSNTIPVANGL